MNVSDRVIGRVSGDYVGYRHSAELVISVRLDSEDRVRETTDHRYVATYKRLGISAGVWNRQRTDFVCCGQIRDALDNMVLYAPGWDAQKVQRLGEIWDAWHLNELNAGCVHQVDNRDVCPETGYMYGHAWLLRELPADIEDEVEAMFARS
jgi:hypothetical protein